MNSEPPKPPGRLRVWFRRRGTLISAESAKSDENALCYCLDRALEAITQRNFIREIFWHVAGYALVFQICLKVFVIVLPFNAVCDLGKLIFKRTGNVYFLRRKLSRLKQRRNPETNETHLSSTVG